MQKKSEETTYSLIINKGREEGFEHYRLDRVSFIAETARLIKRPKKIFLGLGDFLELGDYKQLLDSVFFDDDGSKFENILDKNNRKISQESDVPFSFFKMAVYFPDFLLKNVPTFCVSAIGKKSRLFPGAETFIRQIKKYDPMVLSAMPYEVASEFMKRLGLDKTKLVATEYITKKNDAGYDIYAGGIKSFVSGDRKNLEIEKSIAGSGFLEDDITYIGSGESGIKTFSAVNSVAFNTASSVAAHSRIAVYGPSLESLLSIFNFDGEFNSLLLSEQPEDLLPSLVVVSHKTGMNEELQMIESEHLTMQNNILGQRLEYSGDSFQSVEREIEITFGSSFIDMAEVRSMIEKRMMAYKENPLELVKQIYYIAKQRYKT
ncbi:MAG: hypothetical protein FWG92_05550 [Leptospirales bacterium]|nr:hypothetical protein [Leptospirales bacterium]